VKIPPRSELAQGLSAGQAKFNFAAQGFSLHHWAGKILLCGSHRVGPSWAMFSLSLSWGVFSPFFLDTAQLGERLDSGLVPAAATAISISSSPGKPECWLPLAGSHLWQPTALLVPGTSPVCNEVEKLASAKPSLESLSYSCKCSLPLK